MLMGEQEERRGEGGGEWGVGWDGRGQGSCPQDWNRPGSRGAGRQAGQPCEMDTEESDPGPNGPF